MSREFNPIFKSLVPIDNNLYGLCAYAHYKREKINFIEEYKNQHKGKTPKDKELRKFHERSMNKLDDYRAKGEKDCDNMICNLIVKHIKQSNGVITPSVLAQTATTTTTPIKQSTSIQITNSQPKSSNTKSSWLTSLLVGIAASILATIIFWGGPTNYIFY